MHSYKTILKSLGIILGVVFVILFIVRDFHYFDVKKTTEQVKKIHNTKLKLSDVMGDNLPPDPGVDADKTVEGIDANTNGIRDDVELAVFKEYPNSAKTRAVLLQYALVLQMELTLPILNTETATAVAEKDSTSYDCIGSISEGSVQKIEKYRNFIEKLQFNTIEREKSKNDFNKKVRSFRLQSGCDVNFN
jgi:hypothetical protein